MCLSIVKTAFCAAHFVARHYLSSLPFSNSAGLSPGPKAEQTVPCLRTCSDHESACSSFINCRPANRNLKRFGLISLGSVSLQAVQPMACRSSVVIWGQTTLLRGAQPYLAELLCVKSDPAHPRAKRVGWTDFRRLNVGELTGPFVTRKLGTTGRRCSIRNTGFSPSSLSKSSFA